MDSRQLKTEGGGTAAWQRPGRLQLGTGGRVVAMPAAAFAIVLGMADSAAEPSKG